MSSSSSFSSSSSSSFSAAEDDAMIARVRENGVLFDASHSMYKDGMHKDYIWHQIGTAVNKTPDDCKKRWKNMRNTYKKHKKKSLTQSPPKKQWHLMGRLSFLDAAVEHNKKAAPNAETPAKEVVAEVVAEGEERVEERVEEEEEEEAVVVVAAAEEEEVEAVAVAAAAEEEEMEAVAVAVAAVADVPPSTVRAKKRPRDDDTPTGTVEKSSARRGACAAPKNGGRGRGRGACVAPPDSVDLFFSSVALNVKRLPTRAINKAQMKILSLVAQLEDEYAHPAPFLHHLPPTNYRYTDFRCARSPGPTSVPPQRQDPPFGPPRYGNNSLCVAYDVFAPK